LGVTRPRVGWIVCALAVLALAEPATAQFPLFQQPGQPGALLDPQELEQPRRAPLTITPSLTITGEYNDNIFIDNSNKVSDFIIGFTPGLAIVFERPTYRLGAGYSFTSELFVTETNQSNAFDRQNFWLDTLWRVDPHLTLSLTDTFIFSTDTNLVSRENVATGRDRALSNVLAAGVAWQFAPLWTLRSGASWTLERFQRNALQDSDVYRVDVGVDRRLSPQVTLDADYQFGYFDIENERKTTTHTPRVGVTWRPTATATLVLRAGPSFEVQDGDTRVTPAVTAGYRQRVPFGAVGVSYDREVGTAGGLGGTTHNQLISGFVDVLTLARGLTLQFLPRYSIVESARGDSIDVRSFTAPLQATYRVASWVTLIAGYQFFHQRSDSSVQTNLGTSIANDVDQNRVFFGVQFGYPIRFD
jgi:hypothetical protein